MVKDKDKPPPSETSEPPRHEEAWPTKVYNELKNWVNEGSKAIPAFKYIRALISIAAVLAIVLFWIKLAAVTAIVGTVIVLALAMSSFCL